MEIYRLKDKVPEKRRSNRRGGTCGVGECGESDKNGGLGKCGESDIRSGMIRDDGKIVITDMKSGVKNPERVNIYVNGVFVFSLDVAQVVDYKLKVGSELDVTRFEELRKASEFGKLYQRALEWVLLRPRSVRETKDHLNKKVYEKKLDKGYVDEVLGRLCDKGYIDDYKFAEFWVQNRFVKKGVSRKRLSMELMKKGISREIIEEVLDDGRDDEEELRKMVAKKRSKYDDAEKLMAYLVRQGFSYDLVRKVVEES
jgi:regulatory protein